MTTPVCRHGRATAAAVRLHPATIGTATSGVPSRLRTRLTASQSEAYGGFEAVAVTQRAFKGDTPWNHVAPKRRRHGKNERE